MNHSWIVINEKFLTDSTPPVSILNPAFVCCQAVAQSVKQNGGNPPSKDQHGMLAESAHFEIIVADDHQMREAFHRANQSENTHVHPYPIQALTGNYEAYASALASTSSCDVRYIALALRTSDGAMQTWVNRQYCSDALLPLIRNASLLGWATGFDYPDDTFGFPVADADGVEHSRLTRIGHLFRKEKGNKFDRLLAEGTTTVANFYATKSEDQVSMICVYGDEASIKRLKIPQMSSARMHDDLVAFRKNTDASFQAQQSSGQA